MTTLKTLDNLPPEILLIIAGFCGYGLSRTDRLEIAPDQRNFASLALVNRRLHCMFDSLLWCFNRRYGAYAYGGHLRPVSAVYWAASRNRIDILEKALKYKHPLGSYLERDPIHRAAANGHVAACSWLLDHGAPIEYTPCERIDVGAPFTVFPWPENTVSPGCSPLYTAIMNRQESTAIFLLERGAKFWFREHRGNSSAIHLAAFYGLPTVVEYLVKSKGTDVNLLDQQHDTPLYRAVQSGRNEKTIQILLDLGADINPEHNFQLPLERAIRMGHFSNAMVLLDAGARVNPTKVGRDTLSPLIACTWKEDRFERGFEDDELAQQDEVLRKLITKGADLDRSFGEETPLSSAVEDGTTSAVFELLKAGADMGKRSEEDGKTPFDLVWSLDAPVEEVIGKATLFVAAGARLDTPSPNEHGNTQLEYAIDYCIGQRESRALDAILRVATPQNMHDEYLDDLLDLCLSSRYLQASKILVNHGAVCEEACEHALIWALRLIEEDKLCGTEHEEFSFCLGFLSEIHLEILFREALSIANEELCQVLVTHGIPLPRNEFRPWLHLAASSGSIALVRRLIRLGMDINALDDNFNTPMMTALTCGEIDVAEALFELGADPFHPRPDAECRQLPNMSTQVLSPFEFVIRECRPLDIKKWWMNSPRESRPTEEFYIPRVLAEGPWLCGFLQLLRYQPNNDSSEHNGEMGMGWIAGPNVQKIDRDAERILKLTRAMAQIPAVPERNGDEFW
ncbi:ankyrin [Hypoxylon sp. FL0890]|nr:ankyrin [Hypoxylon sp. FL0890]